MKGWRGHFQHQGFVQVNSNKVLKLLQVELIFLQLLSLVLHTHFVDKYIVTSRVSSSSTHSKQLWIFCVLLWSDDRQLKTFEWTLSKKKKISMSSNTWAVNLANPSTKPFEPWNVHDNFGRYKIPEDKVCHLQMCDLLLPTLLTCPFFFTWLYHIARKALIIVTYVGNLNDKDIFYYCFFIVVDSLLTSLGCFNWNILGCFFTYFSQIYPEKWH